MGKLTISMAIFNSYVKLPEGKLVHKYFLLLYPPISYNSYGKKMKIDHRNRFIDDLPLENGHVQ